jgi:phosphoribosyl 1,2-cyclic phosphodiesterase
MNIRCVGSGSKGNAYLVDDGSTTLLLECGVRFKKIQESCGFKTSNISACLVTHEHQDHCKCIREVMSRGIEVIATKGTYNALNIDVLHTPFASIIDCDDRVGIMIGTFRIFAFQTEHDATEPCGYLINSYVTGEQLLYLTDSYYCRYIFPGLTDIMIECNYDDHTFDRSEDSTSLKKRVIKSHMSLNNCIDFLKANDLSFVDCIHLIHLSDRNSDESRMKRKVAEATGKRVIVF